ncbi:MAG: hypothetical protein IKS35_06970 [Clostridia bacterium]|nr:hypothetical protein [Clostridia bacterium]
MTDLRKTIWKSLCCILLTACMIVGILPITGRTEEDDGEDAGIYKYVEDLRIYENVTLNDARLRAEQSGYILIEQNLNEANGKSVYLAYKPTDDESRGITEIAMLEMNVDYQMSNFQTLINSKVRELYPRAQMLDRAAKEFAEKYRQGSHDAQYAFRMLDLLYADEYGQTLAQAILENRTDANFFNKVLVRSTAGFSAAISHALTIGISDFEDDNWAMRVSKAQSRDMDAGKEERTVFDDRYLQLAEDALHTFRSFASNYRKAEAREFYNGGIALSEENYSDCDSVGDVVDRLCEENVNESDADVIYLLCYELLNRYDFDESTKLGDYLIRVGEQNYDSMDDFRVLYPVLEAMTPAQAEMLSVSDLTLFALYLQNNAEVVKADEKGYTELKEAIQNYNKAAGSPERADDNYTETVSRKKDSISIWAGVNQAIYDEEVAITDDAIRYNTAGSNYAAFTKDNSLQSYLDRIEVYFNLFQYSAGLVTGLAHVVAMFTGYFSLYSAAMAAFALGGAYAVLGVLAMTFFVIEIIAIVALIVWLVVELIAWVWPEDEKDDVGEWTAIPGKVFDIKDISYNGEVHMSYVMYEAVRNQNGQFADLNAGKGKRWNALYFTNSKQVGNAIRVSELEEMFIVQYGGYASATGYSPVTSLGSHDIANLNANTGKIPVYLLYRNRKSASDTSMNTGTSEGDEQTMYLETIKLYSADNETAAKALYKKEVNKGYVLLDLNMAKGGSKAYTYMAYKLTKNRDEALTDIRVCNAYSPDEGSGATLQIGTSTYGLAGNLYNGSSLWITSSPTAGTPIIGAPEFVTDMKKAKSGWEPVNLASGGLAYDFYQGRKTDTGEYVVKEKNFGDHIFLYFNPSVKFTSGTEYLGGVAFFATDAWHDTKEKLLQSYLKDTGYTLFNKTNFGCLNHTFYSSPDEPFAGIKYVRIYMGYTTTYNPYRAIYDVGFYESTTTATSLNAYFTTVENKMSVAYNSVAMYMTGRGDTCTWLDYPDGGRTGIARTMNTNNAFLSATLGNAGAIAKCTVWTKDPRFKFDCYNMTLKGLYVKGHAGEIDSTGQYVPVEKEDEKPLVPDDLYLSNKTADMQGYYPVKNMLNRYERTEVNLAAHSDIGKYGFKKSIKEKYYYSGEGKEYSAYLYVRKDNAEKPRYISSISVMSFTMPELKGDKDTVKAMKQAYKNAADDSTRLGIQAYINAEMIDLNVALKAGDRWTAREETYHTTLRGIEDKYDVAKKTGVGTASYVGVSRTDNASEAIRGILKYKPSSKEEMKNPPRSITVGKAKYYCAGDKITGLDGDYYLYYTTNKGVSPCEPITDFVVDEQILISGATTALTYTAQDRTDEVAKGVGNVKDTLYYHCVYDNTRPNAISRLYIGVGNSEREAKADLLNQGCTAFVPLDLNAAAGGKFIFLGYEKYEIANIVRESYKTEAKYQRAYKNEYSDAIKDVIVTVGEPFRETLERNGILYYPVSDADLNAGTNHGKEIYLYYTRDMSLDKDRIVSVIGLAQFERAPLSTDDYRWEKLLTAEGRRANLNDGCISFSGDYIKENAIHMFMHRYGNVIKPGAEITGGYTGESEKYGQLVAKR